MATTVVSTNTYGTNLTYTFGAAGDFFILTEGTQLVANGYSYLYGTTAGINVTIDGYLWLQGVSGANGSPFYFEGGDTINIGSQATLVLTSTNSPGWGGIMLGAANTPGFGTPGTVFNNWGAITINGSDGMLVGAGSNRIYNHGSITLNGGSISIGNGDLVSNSGTISAVLDAIVGDANSNYVVNHGRINGNVKLGAGADQFDGIGGEITGTVALGDNDDIYFVSDSAILLYEAASQGTDRVESTVDFALGDDFENLTLRGSAKEGVGNELANTILGNGFANVLIGLDGSDVLNGGAGADMLDGGEGIDQLTGGSGADRLIGGGDSDTYYAGALDTIVELAGEGTDLVVISASYTLAANVENIVLSGTGGFSGTGNTLANTIVGNSGNNTITGGLGIDTLDGGLGADSFRYNLYTEGKDIIVGFDTADFMVFKGSAFGGLTTANKAAGFVSRATSNLAVDASDRLIFRQSDDTLWYDSNGSLAGGTKIMIADFSNNFNLTASDILIV